MMKHPSKSIPVGLLAVGNSPRRGVALIMVLSVISVALALSYAMLRSQTTQLIVEENGSRTLDARQAAMAGMNLAIQKMHDASWAGVDTQLAGSLDTNKSYTVTFTTGDPSLSPGDDDYDDYPWRVTLLATGTATDALSGVSATHQIQAVVQLVPRQLSTAPTGWESVSQYTLYQWGEEDVQIELPCHIDGPTYLSGPLSLAQSYPFDAAPFDGAIDEVAIYEDSYDANEVKHVYQAVSGAGPYSGLRDAYEDKSPIAWWRLNDSAGSSVAVDEMGNHNGKYVEADPGVAGIDSTNASQFDGVDDFIDVGSIDITSGDKMTIFAWIKADSFPGGESTIVSKAVTTGDTDHYWSLGTRSVVNKNRLTASVKTQFGTFSAFDMTGDLVAGQWYFVAMVVDGGQLRLYKNGDIAGFTNILGSISQQPYATVFIGEDAPGSSRGQFLRDLNAMRLDDHDDERPLTGPVDLQESEALGNSLSHLQENLGATTNNITPTYTAPGSFPSGVTSYQLYTGGKSYSIESLSNSLSSVTKSADPASNPLGVFRTTGDLTTYGNVDIEGTIVIAMSGSTGGSLNVQGTENSLAAVDLPALYGSSEPVQLPVVIAENDVVSETGNESTLNGMIWAGDKFQQNPKLNAGQMEIEGSVIAKEVQLQGNYYWAGLGTTIWQDAVGLLRLQEFGTLGVGMMGIANWTFYMFLPDETYEYLPEMMEAALSNGTGLMDPTLTLQPESTPVSYHWHDWSGPIFVPHPDDGGLRWDLIEWTDSP